MGKFVGFMMAFFLGQYISYIVELKTLGSADLTKWYDLTHPQITETTTGIGAIFGAVNAGWDWLVALIDMLTWNYAFFGGWLQIIRFLVFIPISVGFVWMIISLLRGSGSE